MKRCVIYARVSTQRQVDDGVSMDSQIEQCRVKARALDADVVEVFRDDGISGRTDNRPGFQAAMAYCAAQRVNYFICWSTSRFGRNLEDALRNAKVLLEWGTQAAYVHQDIDMNTDAGWMLGVITGMMDEMYSRTISRDTLRSMITASRDGFFVGGRAPFGYRVEKVGKRSRLVAHDEHAPIVQAMFQIALHEGLGAQALALRLNADGLKRDGRAWGKSTVAGILKNPSYMGLRLFNQVKDKTREAKPAHEVVQVDSHPALISKDDFERVQKMMKERVPHEVGGTPKSTFAFAGLLKCGICGNGLQIRNGTGRSGALYSYYACMVHKKGAPRCCLKAVGAEAFDAWMVDQLLDKVLTVAVVEKVVQEVRAGSGRWAEERELRRRTMVKEMRATEDRRNNLYDILETQGTRAPNLAELTERLRTLNESIRNIESALRDLEDKPAPDYDLVDVDPQVAVDTIRGVIKACPDAKRLRGLLGTFVQQIAVSNATIVVEYREDALLRSPTPTVHSGVSWLRETHSLRTKRIEIERPLLWPSVRLLAA